ncbi:hypothetical protein GCM10023187_52930 [Nibrella viscosa]|uniref:Caspase family p20 domain-containing protein n=2 Tax=Nibrella viscosa TaxID=1084524 RepID=A0ABP8KZ29_9BACT
MLVAIDGDNDVFTLYDAQTGKSLWTQTAWANWGKTLAFSPNETFFVSANGSSIKVYNTQTGSLLKTMTSDANVEVNTLAFDADGNRLVSGSSSRSKSGSNVLNIWDTQAGKLLQTLPGHTSAVTSVALTPDGNRLLSAGEDSTLKLWDLKTDDELTSMTTVAPAVGFHFLDEGRQVLVITKANILEVRETATLKLLKTYENTGFFTDPNYQPPLTPDGQYEIYVYYQSAFLKPARSFVASSQPTTVSQQVVTKPTGASTSTTSVKPSSPPVSTLTKRYALVIGNSGYKAGRELAGRPLNDARDITARLQALGFTVTKHEDLTDKQAFERAFQQFGRQARGADVALFFYAGHGIEVAGENYIIPIGATLEQKEDVRYEAFPVNTVLEEYRELGAKNSVVLLDACRENPFRSWGRDGGGRGFKTIDLAKVQLDNLFIGYATAPGSVAQNGSGRNGTFTTALLKYLRQGERFDDIFQDTTNEVLTMTNNTQRPFQTSSLRTRLIF